MIGDIHGGLNGLKQVLKQVNFSGQDSIVFLGDYVDGWSESAGTIEFLIKLSQIIPCIFIKGNHDTWCEQWLRSGIPDKKWLVHGGVSTIKSYEELDQLKIEQHLQFFEKMKLFHVDEKNRLFIHAGFTSMHGPEQEFYESNYTWDRTLWEMALTMDKRIKKHSVLFPRRLKLFEEIYIGHTPTLIYEKDSPMQGCNVWNIDTGAAFTGKLSMMDTDTKEFWQSDLLTLLYPGEKGRNRD